MKTKQVLDIMKIMSWIIFVGSCINAGAIIISFFVSVFINQEASKNLYLGLNLSEIYHFGKWQYIGVVLFIISIAVLKAHLFYLVITIFSKINLQHPFSFAVSNLISKISYACLSIGLIAVIASGYAKYLLNRGVSFRLNFDGSEFLFTAGILFIIAYLFKRGIEIQSENELTI